MLPESNVGDASLTGRPSVTDDEWDGFNRRMLARHSELEQIAPGVFPDRDLRPGAFVAKWSGRGKLAVSGWVMPTESEVFLSFNGRIVAVAATEPSSRRPGLRSFRFLVGGSALALAPEGLRVRVSCRLGLLAAKAGGVSVDVQSPKGGRDEIFARLEKGWTLDKWGQIALPISEKSAWKKTVLARYGKLRAFLKNKFDLDLILIAGTLLGLVREGDFIGHDDDFDAAWVSRQTSAEGVRDEMFAILMEMKRAGIRIRPAHTLRFLQAGTKKGKIDLFPTWHEDGHVWLPNSQRLEAGPDLLGDIKETTLNGRPVLIPVRAERYLALHYGENWRTPDKHYREQKKPGVMAGLRRVQLTPQQVDAFRELATRNVRPPT